MGSDNSIIQGTFLDSKWFNPDYLFNQAVYFFQHSYDYARQANGSDIVSTVHTILFFLTLFFLTILSYCIIRVMEIRKKEHAHMHHEIHEFAKNQAEKEVKSKRKEEISHNPRWIKTLDYLFSQHPSDWKLAIIEADTMLESLMTQLGFKGENLGDKLKGATQEKFHNLSAAWEVHTVRNRIAHEGGTFNLSQHEAKRLIALYEQIFREFGFI